MYAVREKWGAIPLAWRVAGVCVQPSERSMQLEAGVGCGRPDAPRVELQVSGGSEALRDAACPRVGDLAAVQHQQNFTAIAHDLCGAVQKVRNQRRVLGAKGEARCHIISGRPGWVAVTVWESKGHQVERSTAMNRGLRLQAAGVDPYQNICTAVHQLAYLAGSALVDVVVIKHSRGQMRRIFTGDERIREAEVPFTHDENPPVRISYCGDPAAADAFWADDTCIGSWRHVGVCAPTVLKLRTHEQAVKFC